MWPFESQEGGADIVGSHVICEVAAQPATPASMRHVSPLAPQSKVSSIPLQRETTLETQLSGIAAGSQRREVATQYAPENGPDRTAHEQSLVKVDPSQHVSAAHEWGRMKVPQVSLAPS
jgi:hypothetical protein